MRIIVILIMLFNSTTTLAQENLGGDFYNIKIDSRTRVTRSQVENGLVDIVTVFESVDSEKPKYLVYLMKSNLDSVISLSEFSNFNVQSKLISDIKCRLVEGFPSSFNGIDGYSYLVDYSNQGKSIVGYLFATVRKKVLFRTLFMIPNEEYYKKYLDEIRGILGTISFE